MADPDIPVAYPTADSEPITAYVVQGTPENTKSSVLTKGRSQRVFVSSKPSSKTLSNAEKQTLQAQGYPSGLIRELARNVLAFPLRIWVVDNSGSMAMGDGHRIVATKKANDVRLIECSRWTELQEAVTYHAQMAALLEAPTVFRLLNDPGRAIGPQQFSVAEKGAKFLEDDVEIAKKTMQRASPSGVTPLSDHIREIRENVVAMEEQLKDAGQKVAIILATDGLPSDHHGVSNQSTRTEFESALRSLEGLPVWIVVRLCTDEDDVVEYYNELDSQLELSLEVLDDFTGEAKEVYEHNKWLNYALPLHRIREMGFSHRLFDLLDERPLTLDEAKQFMELLFGEEKFRDAPDPQIDFRAFTDRLWAVVNTEGNQWNPISKKMGPWIDKKKLQKAYGKKTCTIM